MHFLELDIWHSLARAIPACLLVVIVARCLGRLTGSCGYPVQVIVGVNLLGLVALALSYIPDEIRSSLSLLVAITCGLVTVLEWRSWHQRASAILPASVWTWHRALVAAALLISIGPALSYPAGWDELTYHMELPRRWAEADSPSVQLDLPYSGLPSLCELLFALTYPLEGLIAPRLLTWIVWGHGLVALYQTGCILAGSRIAAVITWAVALSPITLMVSANCYVEAFMLANVAGLCRIMARQVASPLVYRDWVIVGILIGGAMAIKVTAVGLWLLPLLVCWLQPSSQPGTWRSLLCSWLVAVAFATPFYLRPWLATGDPLWPYFAQWFTGETNLIQCSRYHHVLAQSEFGLPGITGLVGGVIALAFAYELYDGYFGWQWLLMSLLAAALLKSHSGGQPKERFGNALLFCSLALYVLWFASSQQARFAVGLLVLVGLSAAVQLTRCRERNQRVLSAGLLLLSVTSLPWTNAGYYLDSWLCVMKIRSPIDYLRDGVGDSYLELSAWLAENTAADDEVVTLFEHRLVYMPRGTEIATPYFQCKYFQRPESQTAEDVEEELRRQGVDYLVLTTRPMGPDVSPAHILAQQLWSGIIDQCIARGTLKVVWKSDMHAVVARSQP